MLLYGHWKETPLYIAVQKGNKIIVQTLLAMKANPNITSSVSSYKIKIMSSVYLNDIKCMFNLILYVNYWILCWHLLMTSVVAFSNERH